MSSLWPSQGAAGADVQAPLPGQEGVGLLDRMRGAFGRGAGGVGPADTPASRVDSRSFLEKSFPSLFQIKPREVIVFSRQLATLIAAGIQLLPALGQLGEQVGGSRGFRRVLRDMTQDLATGSSFSQAVDVHPSVFSETFRRTVAVGERAGRVELVLRQLADFMEKENEVGKKFAGAMVYPIIVLVVSIGVGAILTTTALPPMVSMFSQLDTDLPLPTKVLMGLSNFIRSYILALLGLGVVMAVGVVWLVGHPKGRYMLDRWRLNAPLLGPPVHLREMSRFSRTLSMLLTAGLPLQEIMELMPQTTNNVVMREALENVRGELLLGHGLSGPMSHIPIFPPMLLQMVAVGEETNSLEETLPVVADFYEAAAAERIAQFIGALTPMMTIGISVVAAFIAMAVIMPMYSLTGAIGGATGQ